MKIEFDESQVVSKILEECTEEPISTMLENGPQQNLRDPYRLLCFVKDDGLYLNIIFL